VVNKHILPFADHEHGYIGNTALIIGNATVCTGGFTVILPWSLRLKRLNSEPLDSETDSSRAKAFAARSRSAIQLEKRDTSVNGRLDAFVD